MRATLTTVVGVSSLLLSTVPYCSGFRGLRSTFASSASVGVERRIRPAFSPAPAAAGGGTSLRSASAVAPPGDGAEGSSGPYDGIDYAALLYKYPVGLLGQTSLIYAFLAGVDRAFSSLSFRAPFALNFLFMYAFNLKSSAFSLFPIRYSGGEDNRDFNDKKKPTWTPPGIAFVFGWPLLTFGLRAYTAAMVIDAMGGKYATLPIMSLMFHLTLGNFWNTTNLVERRLGVSVLVLCGMWLTKALTAWRFYQVDPLAGKLLALTLTWISAAVSLEVRTWQINPDLDTGRREPLLPTRRRAREGEVAGAGHPKWTTKFRWET